MKRLAVIGAVVSLTLCLTPAAYSQSNQLQQGTQVHLTLLNGLSTTVARDGDPFVATVSEPVFLGGQMILPAGAKVNGQVSNVTHPKRFAMIRGEASMNLVFRSIEVQSRIIPAQMSIISIYSGGADAGKSRKDLQTVEGVVVEQKRDIKGDVVAVAMGTGGGSVVGAVFSHVLRGTVIGLAGSSAYIVMRRGKDVELPAQTQMLVRLDSNVTLPVLPKTTALAATDSLSGQR
jgi:hypothetical protein